MKHIKTIEEDLRLIKESELLNHKKPSPLSSFATKLFFAFGGLLTLLLLASFIFLSYPIDHILTSKLESHTPIANTILIGNLTLIFEQNTDQQLQTLYLNQQKVEFSVCLLGTKDLNTYHLTSLYTPKMYKQTFNHVIFEPCNKDTLIMLHSHPYKSCLASDTDINTLKQTKQTNPDILMVVMCEPQRYSVYS